MNSLKGLLYSSLGFLSKRIPYLFSFKNVLLISLFLGGIQVFVTIFLEPHGTDNYQAPYRNLRLSGFALCFIFPFLLFYGLERWFYHLNAKVWRVYHEIISKSFLGISIATASYFYNITIINSITPSFDRWLEHLLVFAWPYVPLFIPFLIIIYAILYKNHSSQEHLIKIKGQNKEDVLKISDKQFVYAESDQNYVTIYYINGEELDKKLMRSSLQDMENQIDSAIRVHRSYIINPLYLEIIQGNKRKRTAVLKNVDFPIPVSQNFDEKNIYWPSH
jgi:hypothetical protein